MDDEDEAPVVIVCQGPPACMLEGEAQAAAMANGAANCVWCMRITCHADGSETVREPGHA